MSNRRTKPDQGFYKVRDRQLKNVSTQTTKPEQNKDLKAKWSELLLRNKNFLPLLSAMKTVDNLVLEIVRVCPAGTAISKCPGGEKWQDAASWINDTLVLLDAYDRKDCSYCSRCCSSGGRQEGELDEKEGAVEAKNKSVHLQQS